MHFTGRVNLLSEEGQQLGSIVFSEGAIINAHDSSQDGMRALESLFIKEFSQSLKFVVEPELVTKEKKQIHFPFSVIKKKVSDLIASYKSAKLKAPPMEIKLAINVNEFKVGKSLSSDEYDTLCVICDYNKVREIYNMSKLEKHRLTQALVSLREKEMVKVIS